MKAKAWIIVVVVAIAWFIVISMIASNNMYSEEEACYIACYIGHPKVERQF